MHGTSNTTTNCKYIQCDPPPQVLLLSDILPSVILQIWQYLAHSSDNSSGATDTLNSETLNKLSEILYWHFPLNKLVKTTLFIKTCFRFRLKKVSRHQTFDRRQNVERRSQNFSTDKLSTPTHVSLCQVQTPTAGSLSLRSADQLAWADRLTNVGLTSL
jgi:hypothetical protein